MSCCRLALAWMWLLFVPYSLVAQTFDPASRAAAIAPFVDKQTFVVAHADLARIDLAELRRFGQTVVPGIPPAAEKKLREDESLWSDWLKGLIDAGATEVYVVGSLSDLPARPPFGVVVLNEGADAKRIVAHLQGPESKPIEWPAGMKFEVVRGALCIAPAETIERLQELEGADPAMLAQGFKVAGDTALQAVVLQSDDSRRVLSETLPPLPGALSEYSGKDLATIEYAAIGLDLPPKPALRLGVQATDEAAAARLHQLALDALGMGKQSAEAQELLPNYDEFTKLLTPKLAGNRLSLMINQNNGGVDKLMALVAQPVKRARQAAGRVSALNNLKQLGLAMHIYHDAMGAFPPAVSAKDGKPLLSWRVAILPYIEEKELYDQFHHDEPWDSEHNLKLLAKMPKVFQAPGVELKEGMTTYVVPSGDTLVFGGERKTRISDITDGTSNTIMIVEANADRAVPWTKPQDLEVDLEKPLAGLGEARDKGFTAVFCDGAVRFISGSIDPGKLRKLLERNDGMPVDGF